jgi:hypothetical protein
MAVTLFPGPMGKSDALEDARMILLAEDHRGFDFIDAEIAAPPDDIAVTPALQTDVPRDAAFGLACTAGSVHILEKFDAIAFLPEPIGAVGGNVGVDNDRASGFPHTNDDDAELVSEVRKMTPITSGNGDMEDGHGHRAP